MAPNRNEDGPAVVQRAAGNPGVDQVEVWRRGARAADRRPTRRSLGRAGQQNPLATGQDAGHDGQPGIVIEPEDMADLVDQDGEQVDAPEGRAGGVCCAAGIFLGLAELGTVGGGGIDEPAAAGGGRVERDAQAVGMADFAGWQIGDADVEVGEATGVGGGESGGCPEPDRFGEHRTNVGVGQNCCRGRRSG